MTTPEIPAEIMREAEAAIERHRSTDGAALSNYAAMRDSICRALLARDQRAAEIARNAYSTIWNNLSEGDEMSSLDGESIASCITTYKEPS